MPTSAIKDLLKKWADVRVMVLEWHPNQAGVSRCNVDLEGEKDFNDDQKKEFTDCVQSILGFQDYDDEDVETGIACDSEDCGFQILNYEEIVTSVQEECGPVDDETDEDEDNSNNESSEGPSNADAFSALETAMEWYEQQSVCCCPTQLLLLNRIRELAAKNEGVQCVRFHILYGLNSVFGYPNNRVSERCPVAIDSDKRRSTAIVVVCCPTRMQS
ncbi:uncharacterized protein TNCV_1156141 [Trichonephila clavipes]|nr:uncharacterized protein TNCV_1156141 [Trichonephila clavipes]